jgi:hypothetical protein
MQWSAEVAVLICRIYNAVVERLRSDDGETSDEFSKRQGRNDERYPPESRHDTLAPSPDLDPIDNATHGAQQLWFFNAHQNTHQDTKDVGDRCVSKTIPAPRNSAAPRNADTSISRFQCSADFIRCSRSQPPRWGPKTRPDPAACFGTELA